MRLFVAINLPDALREEIHDAVAPLREDGVPARWVKASSYHVTMKFIGEVRPDDGNAMEEMLRRCVSGYRPVAVGLEEVGAFPSLRRPRVIWLGVTPTPQLRALKHDLEHAYARLGIERETRAFRPHVTLGRVDDDADAGDFRDFESLAREIGVEAQFTASHLDLMRSRLRPDGPEYSLEARVALSPGDG
jgi:2'-5' RNA ligase